MLTHNIYTPFIRISFTLHVKPGDIIVNGTTRGQEIKQDLSLVSREITYSMSKGPFIFCLPFGISVYNPKLNTDTNAHTHLNIR